VISRPAGDKALPVRGLAQRADNSGWISFENQRKGVSSFCCKNAEKLESFGQGAPCGRNYSEFFHLFVRIHQIRMF